MIGTLVTGVSSVPDGEHFVILEFSSFMVPGDERSRTHPGHGYPEHTETTVQYVVYGDRASWEAEIKKRMTATLVYSPRQWAPLICRRPEIGVTVDVRIK